MNTQDNNNNYEGPGCCTGHDHVHDHSECDSETDERKPVKQEPLPVSKPAVASNPWDHIRVVTKDGLELTPEEKSEYARWAYRKYNSPKEYVDYVEVAPDDEDPGMVKTWCHMKQQPFQRIRRITGYLVGTVDRFCDAKRAEERDRVKHAMGSLAHEHTIGLVQG